MHSTSITIQQVPAQAPSAAQRIPALDFTKGTLVLIMVLYHWINYFIGPDWPYYRYLRFLTPSFIFIAGFMISNVYLAKYNPPDIRLCRRLLLRGIKLLGIFLALNLLRYLAVPFLANRGPAAGYTIADGQSLLRVLVTGDFDKKIVSFDILVPIAYLLILSGLLVIALRQNKYIFHATYVILILIITILSFNKIESPNLGIIAIGMLGVLAGFAPIEKINRIVRHYYILAFAYSLYLYAISVWDVPYPLETVGTLLSVSIIYRVGAIDWRSGRLLDVVILLGKYSLLGYIAQIAILQVIKACLWRSNYEGARLILSLAAGVALTIISVVAMDWARKRARGVDRTYRAVFS